MQELQVIRRENHAHREQEDVHLHVRESFVPDDLCADARDRRRHLDDRRAQEAETVAPGGHVQDEPRDGGVGVDCGGR